MQTLLNPQLKHCFMLLICYQIIQLNCFFLIVHICIILTDHFISYTQFQFSFIILYSAKSQQRLHQGGLSCKVQTLQLYRENPNNAQQTTPQQSKILVHTDLMASHSSCGWVHINHVSLPFHHIPRVPLLD